MTTTGPDPDEHRITPSEEAMAKRPARALSADERRVLGLLAEGRTSGEIAERLGWPSQRVNGCLTGAITALGAHSKIEAIILAYRRGEIGTSSQV